MTTHYCYNYYDVNVHNQQWKLKTKSVNKTTIINITSSILLQGIAFISTPIFSRMLGTEQYGVFSVYNSWILILTCFMGLGVTNSISTGRYHFKDTYLSFRSSIFLFATVLSIGLFLVYGILIKPISNFLEYGVGLSVLLFIAAYGHCIVSFSQEVFIYEKKPLLNLILSVSVSVGVVIVSVILIRLIGGHDDSLKYLGRIYGAVIPYVTAALICGFLIFLAKPTGLKTEYCRYGLVVGMPIVFHLLAHNVLSQSDRVMMKGMHISESEIGIYSLYYTLSAALNAVLRALNTSWCPFYYDDLSERNWDKLKTKCRNYLELFTVITIGFILLSREVGMLMGGEEYWSGLNVLPIVTLSVFFTFMYQFPVNFEFFNKKTKVIATGTVGAAVLNIILNYFMIRPWGMYGAGIATAISYGCLFLFHYYKVHHLKDVDMRFHMKIVEFLPWLGFVLIAVICYYVMWNLPVLRWCIGVVFGAYELLRIKNRNSIF